MSGEPLYLTLIRQGDTLVADLAEMAPVVPRHACQIEESLLRDINRELALIAARDHTQIWLSSTQRTAASRRVEQDLKRLGGLMFSHLFPTAIRQRLMASDPTELFLRLDDQLVHVPWELAFDGESFLLNKFRIGRHVVTHQTPPPAEAQCLNHASRLSMCIVVDPTETLEAAGREAERLMELLMVCDDLDISMMAGKPVRKIDLLHALNEYDVVHYAGHAEFNEADPSRSGWILQDAVLTAAELRRVQHPPLLVFSNACQAGVTTRWQSATRYDGQTFGIGSAFLLAGTQNYIGTFCPVHDGHSATFAADFYQHLTQGASIGNALAAARQHAYLEADVSGLLWASYMHYGNPTFRLPLAPQASVEMGSPGLASAAEPADGTAAPLVSEPHYQPLEAGSRSVATTITPNTDYEPWVEAAKPNSVPDNPTTMSPPDPTTRSRDFWTLWLARGGVSMLALVVVGMALFYIGALSRAATQLPEQAYQALERGEWRQAESMFRQLRDDSTPALQSQGYAGLAAVAYARGEQEDALRLLQAAQGLDGENGYGYFLCAQAAVALSRGTLQKASDFLTRLQPNAFTLPYCRQLHGRMQTH